jgi:hypothetical protein
VLERLVQVGEIHAQAVEGIATGASRLAETVGGLVLEVGQQGSGAATRALRSECPGRPWHTPGAPAGATDFCV